MTLPPIYTERKKIRFEPRHASLCTLSPREGDIKTEKQEEESGREEENGREWKRER